MCDLHGHSAKGEGAFSIFLNRHQSNLTDPNQNQCREISGLICCRKSTGIQLRSQNVCRDTGAGQRQRHM